MFTGATPLVDSRPLATGPPVGVLFILCVCPPCEAESPGKIREPGNLLQMWRDAYVIQFANQHGGGLLSLSKTQ